MIKLIYCFKKKSGMTDAEFHRYWKETHGPIAARIPGLRRYVQCHGVGVVGGLKSPDYDGAAEVWFDDDKALAHAMGSPELRAAFEDERNFIDHAHTSILVTEEHVVLGST